MVDLRAGECVGTDFTEWDTLDQLDACRRCTVRARCLAFALDNETRYDARNGIVYGGKTGKQRAAILHARTANRPVS